MAHEGGGTRRPRGLLAETSEPLVLCLSSGVTAAAAVLATVFVAGGVVRQDTKFFALGVGLAAAGGVAALAPTLPRAPGWRRLRFALVTLGLGGVALVAVRGLRAVGELSLEPGRRDRPGAPAPRTSPNVLLVTFYAAVPFPRRGDWPQWRAFDDTWASSPRRDASLATLLTGEEPIEHRVLFDGDPLRPGARLLAEQLSASGFETARFGGAGLPRWSRRGFDRWEPEENSGHEGGAPLPAALAWLAQKGSKPRFAHAALNSASPDLLDRLAELPSTGTEVVVISLGDEGPSGSAAEPASPSSAEWTSGSVAAGLWWGSPALPSAVPSRPRGLVSVLPTLNERVGVPVPPSADAGSLFDEVDPVQVLVVSMEHRRDGPHRLLARQVDAVVAIDVTLLGRHPFDDWELVGAAQEHFVYRNGVRFELPPAPEVRERMLENLLRWRHANGQFEAAIR